MYYGPGKLLSGRKWLVLLGASLSFYAILEWKGLIFLLATSGTTWLSAGILDFLQDKCREKRKECTDRKEKAAVKASSYYRFSDGTDRLTSSQESVPLVA